jgi:AraC-like DNA-binding protein
MPGTAGRGTTHAFPEHWPRENNIICATARVAQHSLYPSDLSIKTVRHGRETFLFDNASLTVDDHVYLILNGTRPYGSEIHSEKAVDTFSIFFRPGLVDEVFCSLVATLDELLDGQDAPLRQAPQFYEHLLEHDELVSPVLRYIEKTCRSGHEDTGWYEEQCRFLLQKMLQKQHRLTGVMDVIRAVRRRTRAELFRRLLRATDYMHARYDRPISLEDIAATACLTPHHFLCVFRQVFAITPWQFVLRKRVAEAQRLLVSSDMAVTEIGARIGFESRSSFFRSFRNLTGRSPQAYRGGRAAVESNF